MRLLTHRSFPWFRPRSTHVFVLCWFSSFLSLPTTSVVILIKGILLLLLVYLRSLVLDNSASLVDTLALFGRLIALFGLVCWTILNRQRGFIQGLSLHWRLLSWQTGILCDQSWKLVVLCDFSLRWNSRVGCSDGLLRLQIAYISWIVLIKLVTKGCLVWIVRTSFGWQLFGSEGAIILIKGSIIISNHPFSIVPIKTDLDLRVILVWNFLVTFVDQLIMR